MTTDLDLVLEKIEKSARLLKLYEGADHIDMLTAMLLLGLISGQASRVPQLESQLAEMIEFSNKLLANDGVRLVPNGGRA